MQQLLTPETFEFFARYLLAGFVFLSARSWFVAGERPKPNEAIFESIILSLVNQMIALVTLGWVQSDTGVATPTAFLIAEVVVQPMIIGALAGWLAMRNWLPNGVRRLFMPAIRPVNPAFDYAFGSAEGASFVVLSYDDGRVIYGYFGARSITGPDEQSGGIYVERIYEIGKDEETWVEASPERGAWLTLTGLRSIEFIAEEDI